LKITLGQFEPVLGDKPTNLERMTEVFETAQEQESDLILFPELCLTGYFIQDFDEDLAEPTTGPSIRYMRKLCREFQIYTVFSWPELGDDGQIYNSACLINRQGDVAGNYRKVHLYDREKEIFEHGHSFDVFETELGRIGIMVCYDLDFPESARILNMKDADIILVPTNNFYPYERYQETYLKSRSMENEIPIAICNRTGKEQNLEYFGESAIYDAHGHQLLKLNHESQSETVEVNLNMERDVKLSYKSNRLPRTYTTLSQNGE